VTRDKSNACQGPPSPILCESFDEDKRAQMIQPNRRAILTALPAFLLGACGGGDQATSASPTAGPFEADPPAAPPPSPGPPAATGSVTPATEDAEMLPTSASGDPPQFLTWDAGSGPTRELWSVHLGLPWKNRITGDWLDAMQRAQGTSAYAAISVTTAPKLYAFDITVLAARWLRSGENRGALLRASGTSSVTWAGRLAIDTSTRPTLEVTTSAGRFVCRCLALASYSTTTAAGMDTRLRTRNTPDQPVIVQFDLSEVRGDVASAVVKLYCEAKSSLPLDVCVFEADPPRFQLGSSGIKQTLGIAAIHPGDAGLRSHPDVIRAGDFSDLNAGVLFDQYNFNLPYSPYEQLPDPDAPGTVMFRGSFNPSPTDAGINRGSFTGRIETMRAKYDDPLRPPVVVTEKLFCRLYFYLESDWNSTRDGNKMAMGWDLRMGWWNDAQGGYWQSTTGNGGAPGTGLKLFAPRLKNGGGQVADRWEYQGHSIRMEAGRAPGDGNPYSNLRPIQSYVYNLDQPTSYGQMLRLGAGVISKGRWHCIEQQIQINSIVGPFDAQGNGIAIADGVLRTWLDGVLCSEHTNLRWRRHPDMGVQGPWVNWFYGGKRPTEVPMHYRMNHFVLARQYIGPRIS
jgi:hypothetical protein